MSSSSAEESEVLAANAAFYRAFAGRDLGAMDALWARQVPVACVHPGYDVIQGRLDVMASWRAILGNSQGTAISCSRPSACVLGETALVVCTEMVDGAELCATNVFAREDGAWKLVHHQAGPVLRRPSGTKKSPPTPPRTLN
jgi:ketosteroid isomerase-like protein